MIMPSVCLLASAILKRSWGYIREMINAYREYVAREQAHVISEMVMIL